ncbi:hypothetical protein AVEN_80616-1 [Araneus ventricosus]|uniref:Uncharacterized protein n=1 Tax=Araneus ventricosus TaxID=182803 RepID=A0A4Y2QZ22_ARAVE|nr:hypothetical protein AVEN_247446-1 [Araneus ventricosus]GBN68476.1 hypothetical protein AVEN_80616-1 [Araneus ventricosus]
MHEPLTGTPITFRRFYFAERDTHRGGASGVFGRDRDPVRNAAPSGKIFVPLHATGYSTMLQTGKIAPQQCESYGWEESFTGISMERLAAATSGSPTLATILATNLATKYGISMVLESSRYFH